MYVGNLSVLLFQGLSYILPIMMYLILSPTHPSQGKKSWGNVMFQFHMSSTLEDRCGDGKFSVETRDGRPLYADCSRFIPLRPAETRLKNYWQLRFGGDP